MGDGPSPPFESLDYIYVPAPDFETAVRFYTEAIGGELRWRIHNGGVWVGAIRIAGIGPVTLLASHLEAGQTVLIYRVKNLEDSRRRLVASGWTDLDEPFEIPQGPCLVFRDPGGQRVAMYERVRPGMDEQFEGRFDSYPIEG
jgi:predicted enzyme related to lactoylglutathione lyase